MQLCRFQNVAAWERNIHEDEELSASGISR